VILVTQSIKPKSTLFFSLFALIFVFSCKHEAGDILPPELTGPTWQSLGLTGKWVRRLVLAEPFLYACVGMDGLWRLNLQSLDTNWVYVGLADTSLGRHNTFGVIDVIISESNHDWLLAIARPAGLSGHAIFRSLDGGKTWQRADFNLMYTTAGGYSGYFHPNRLLQLGDVIFAAGDGANVFRTQDFGATWETLQGGGEPGLIDIRAFVSHQQFNDVIWVGGWNAYSRAFLAKSTDALSTLFIFKPLVNIDLSGVNSIVLDPVDTNVVYAGLFSQTIKTTDAGKTWKAIFEQETNAMLLDPNDGSHLWAATLDELWETRDAGTTWTQIEANFLIPVEVSGNANIMDMIWDEKRRVIYMGTSTGIFQYRP